MRAIRLLRHAAAIYDHPDSELAAGARRAKAGGFQAGAEWMRAGLAELRDGQRPQGVAAFTKLGCFKYGLASLAALIVFATAMVGASWWFLLLVPIAFYAIESPMVFAFPCALDGYSAPLVRSHQLVKRAGFLSATWTTMQLAASMLFGGLFGRGALRSWCLGCLAVLIWYERVQAAELQG